MTDSLPVGSDPTLSETLNPSPPSLKPYQLRGVEWLRQHPQGILTCPMGAGKTAIACKAMPDGPVVIVAPLRVATQVWPKELALWAPERRFTVLSGTSDQRRKQLAVREPIVILNFELIPWAVVNGVFDGCQCLVIDELSRMKGVQGSTFRAFRKVLPTIPVRWGLTGTLISQGVIDAWGQVWCIDLGKSLGRSFSSFTREFLVTGREYWDLHTQEGAEERLADKIAPFVYRIAPEDYADHLPPLTVYREVVPLPPGVAEQYATLAENFCLGSDVAAGSAGVLSGKLEQLARGAVYPNPLLGERQPAVWFYRDRILRALDLLQDRQPTLVVYQYLFELEALLSALPAPVLGNGDTGKILEDWNAGRLPVLYLHARAGGHGLNLQFGGRRILWLGAPWSLDLWSQVNARLHRQGAPGETVVFVLVSPGTVDDDVLSALENKADVRDTVDAALKKLLT